MKFEVITQDHGFEGEVYRHTPRLNDPPPLKGAYAVDRWFEEKYDPFKKHFGFKEPKWEEGGRNHREFVPEGKHPLLSKEKYRETLDRRWMIEVRTLEELVDLMHITNEDFGISMANAEYAKETGIIGEIIVGCWCW